MQVVRLVDAFLAEAVVRTLGARLGAVAARLDTADQQASIDVDLARIGIKHLAGNFPDARSHRVIPKAASSCRLSSGLSWSTYAWMPSLCAASSRATSSCPFSLSE